MTCRTGVWNTIALDVREATEADLADILSLYAQPDLDDGRVLTVEGARAIFRRMASYPDYRLWVATRDGDVVGTFALLIMDNLAHLGAPSGIVEDVVVRRGWRGRGVGRTMMRFAMERCRARGCYKLALSSHLARERAHEFYEALGFEQHGWSFAVNVAAAADRSSAH
jgi:GNAT superfamily N-acetyltransferase